MQAKSKTEPLHEVVLHPGDFYFGGGRTRVRTLLGSCVSITLWHPKQHIGGMCHYLLPARNKPRLPNAELDGHYAEEAISMFTRELRLTRTKPADFEVKLFGGGNMFPEHSRGKVCGMAECTEALRRRCGDVACKNIQMGHELLASNDFNVTTEHVGGVGYRQLIFEIWSGDVWLRRGTPLKTPMAARRKRNL